MVKDFKINDLADQLAQNPLNLPYERAKRRYEHPGRTTTRSFTFDPVPKERGEEIKRGERCRRGLFYHRPPLRLRVDSVVYVFVFEMMILCIADDDVGL